MFHLSQIVKRSVQSAANNGAGSNEDISAHTQSMSWTGPYDTDSVELKDDSGWDTDLEIEGLSNFLAKQYIRYLKRQVEWSQVIVC